MCFFPQPNLNYKGVAYQKGVTSFECGYCPECLQKRSRSWVVRAYYEAKAHKEGACMVTLTYDDFLRDNQGRILRDRFGNPLEKPVVERSVVKRDIQTFIKRLRAYFKYHYNKTDIKYMACAEYGERTGRAHYHCVLFGVRFRDLVHYKKSKRGHQIFMSHTLTKLWSHGICTVDCTTASAQIIRYCTKYTAKSRGGDTFMLASQGLGLDLMIKNFNGIGYVIEGRRYPIPKRVWNEVIQARYPDRKMDFHYTSRDDTRGKALRKRFRMIRDRDPQYQKYLAYWQYQANINPRNRMSLQTKISLLPDSKYYGYKQQARAFMWLRMRGVNVPSPRSNQKSYVEHWLWEQLKLGPLKRSPHFLEVFRNYAPQEMRDYVSDTCRYPSCHITASDRKKALKFNPYTGKFGRDKKILDLGFEIFPQTLDNHPFMPYNGENPF